MRDRVLFHSPRKGHCRRSLRWAFTAMAAAVVGTVVPLAVSPQRLVSWQFKYADGVIERGALRVTGFHCLVETAVSDSDAPTTTARIFREEITPWNKGVFGGLSYQVVTQGRLATSVVTTIGGTSYDLLNGRAPLEAGTRLAQELSCHRPQMLFNCLDLGVRLLHRDAAIGAIRPYSYLERPRTSACSPVR